MINRMRNAPGQKNDGLQPALVIAKSSACSAMRFAVGWQEVLLEGDPTIVSGHQYIKGGKPDAMMRLDFKERVVVVSGQAVVKKLFY